MDYETFEKICKEEAGYGDEYVVDNAFRYNYFPDLDKDDGPFLVISYETGGARGGSCWGGEAQFYTETPPENPYTKLETVLEKTTPDISFLKYRKIISMGSSFEYTEGAYYGNYTEYRAIIYSIPKLYKFLELNDA